MATDKERQMLFKNKGKDSEVNFNLIAVRGISKR